MYNKLITATSKTDTHLVFDIRYSIPLTEVSEELANDVCDMFNKQMPIPVERSIEFSKSEEGKELFKVIVQPKI
jgi:capsular polysaccharide biosynthesis protein